MRVNWAAIAQSVIVALLLAVGGMAWSTYQAAARLPQVETEIAKLQSKLDEIKARAEAADERQSDQIADMKITLAVLESRSADEGARHGKMFAPATMEGR